LKRAREKKRGEGRERGRRGDKKFIKD